MLLRALVLFAMVACSGRHVPSTDGGPAAGDAGALRDAASGDVTAPNDAGSCADPNSPCADDMVASETRPCLPWETWCVRVGLCGSGEPRWCRPDSGCEAVPSCQPGERESMTPCGLDEPDCTVRTLCNAAVFCRPETNCNDVPSCPPNQLGSVIPCGGNEAACRGIFVCSEARWCREDEGCDAVPNCARGVATNYPCVEGEGYCERSSACGTTIFCRF